MNNPNVPVAIKAHELAQARAIVEAEYGSLNLDQKLDRWSSLRPPEICAPVEYHELFVEAQDAYIGGADYPALTAACCVGERILNHLLIRIRPYKSASRRYKEIWSKESVQDWDRAIAILAEWQVLQGDLPGQFESLLALRNPAVHFGSLEGRAAKAAEALELIHRITDSLFGMRHARFFRAPGEFYVRKDYEPDAVTREFVLPHCHLVGPNHRIEGGPGKLLLVDPGPYEDREIADDEFARLREEAQQARSEA